MWAKHLTLIFHIWRLSLLFFSSFNKSLNMSLLWSPLPQKKLLLNCLEARIYLLYVLQISAVLPGQKEHFRFPQLHSMTSFYAMYSTYRYLQFSCELRLLLIPVQALFNSPQLKRSTCPFSDILNQVLTRRNDVADIRNCRYLEWQTHEWQKWRHLSEQERYLRISVIQL